MNNLTANEMVILIGEILTFIGVVITVIGTHLNGKRSMLRAEKMHDQIKEVKLEINGRLTELLSAIGDKREAEGFLKGKMAERANPSQYVFERKETPETKEPPG